MAYQISVHAKQKKDAALADTLAQLLDHVENEIVEFKAASNHIDLHKLGQYFSASATKPVSETNALAGWCSVWMIKPIKSWEQNIKIVPVL